MFIEQLYKLVASLCLHTQVASDPFDIQMADPYAGENVADYDMYVIPGDSLFT